MTRTKKNDLATKRDGKGFLNNHHDFSGAKCQPSFCHCYQAHFSLTVKSESVCLFVCLSL